MRWWVGNVDVDVLTEKEVSSVLEHLRIEIHVHSTHDDG